jgi:hypothetical protein
MTKRWMDGINTQAMDKFMVDLRSGEFKQGRNVLKNNREELCCLGVATYTNMDECGLQERDGIDRAVFFDKDGVTYTALLPNLVADYLGIPASYRENSHVDGSIFVVAHEDDITTPHKEVDGRPVVDVIGLNDADKKTFAEIADRFEETFMVDVED